MERCVAMNPFSQTLGATPLPDCAYLLSRNLILERLQKEYYNLDMAHVSPDLRLKHIWAPPTGRKNLNAFLRLKLST
jgi:hypothetical protein